jgi:hypothetical protein
MSSNPPTTFLCAIAGCGRSFNKAHGLATHQRSCRKKIEDRKRDAAYEAERLPPNLTSASGKYLCLADMIEPPKF